MTERERVSMRTLVETVLRSGDLMPRGSMRRLLMGAQGHLAAQKLAAGAEYRAEVHVSCAFEHAGVALDITGRVDGLIETAEGIAVEEYKTVVREESIPDEGDPLHWAQAEGYAHMLCVSKSLPSCEVRLLYITVDGRALARMTRSLGAEELRRRFEELARTYALLIASQRAWMEVRNRSLTELGFPFEGFRPGQRAFAGDVYRAARDGTRVFAQAPTGTGKTAAALFGALKALGEGRCERVFYLTARVTGRIAAQETLKRLRERGMRARCVTLTAKDSVCPHPSVPCHPEFCARADGFFDRLPAALAEALEEETIAREEVERIAEKHSICPFEFGLEIADSCDVIVGDFNYGFDPTVRLRRFFEEKNAGNFVLVDEAHQLIERARDMFSAPLSEEGVRNLRKAYAKAHGRKGKPYKTLTALVKAFEGLGEPKSEGTLQKERIEPVLAAVDAAREALVEVEFSDDESVLTLMELWWVSLVYEGFDENLCILYNRLRKHVDIRLWCMDPATRLDEQMASMCGVVFFSATLAPAAYVRDVLGGDASAHYAAYPSPFPRENLLVLRHAGISTRYVDREKTVAELAEVIASACARRGNHLVFFPSYGYMNGVLAVLRPLIPEETRVLVQSGGMDDAARNEFLACFGEHPEGTTVGFAVMGGAFSESIDLPGSRLTGAVIVGVGLPQVCLEREQLRIHHDPNGFEYAYVYPGMNRVCQAAGRVIRTPDDRGFVLLIDTRYAHRQYTALFPAHWSVRDARTPSDVAREISRHMGEAY